MSTSAKVTAIVVTYNRKDLLLECLNALLNQTVSLYSVILIDNASTDGTEELLREKGILDNPIIDYVKMDTNTGGSGGFYRGLEIAESKGEADWFWIMDDDTIPYENSLENLLNAASLLPDSSFFASCVRGVKGEPMNVPIIDNKKCVNGYPDWYMRLSDSLVRIKTATFVSLLINCEAVKKCGLPCRDYFIWGDDTEYTLRLTRYFGPAYLVGNSWVCHKRFNAKSISINNEDDPKRVKNYYYYHRNNLINTRLYYGHKAYVKKMIKFALNSFKLLFKKSGGTRFLTIQRGIFGAISQYKTFKNYILNQVSD